MKETKKLQYGFTLIELLAIIVILAIIAVITVPIILNIIENSKRGAAHDSAYGYKDAINKWYVMKLSSDSNYNIPDGEYRVGELGEQVEGQKPDSNSSWFRVMNNEITEGCLQFDEYKVEISSGEVGNAEKGICADTSSWIDNLTIGIKVDNVQYYTGGSETEPDNVVYFDPTSDTGKCDTYVEANSATGIKAGCMRWFIYSIDDKGTSTEADDVVNMILDHNTTERIAWNNSNIHFSTNYAGPSTSFKTQFGNDTSGWTSNKIISPNPNQYIAEWRYNDTDYAYTITYTTKARLIGADEVARIKGDSSWTYVNASSGISSNNYSYLKTNLNSSQPVGYWTNSPYYSVSEDAWRVYYDGSLNDYYIYSTATGIRPVISVLKSNLL